MRKLSRKSASIAKLGPGGGSVSTDRILAEQPLYLSAMKTASGLDTYEGAFAMHLRHIEKDMDACVDDRGNLLSMSIVLMGIGLSFLIAGIAINV